MSPRHYIFKLKNKKIKFKSLENSHTQGKDLALKQSKIYTAASPPSHATFTVTSPPSPSPSY